MAIQVDGRGLCESHFTVFFGPRGQDKVMVSPVAEKPDPLLKRFKILVPECSIAVEKIY